LAHKFTGKERDTETGLDNFGARFNSSSFGLWLAKISSVSKIVCFRYFPRKHVNITRGIEPAIPPQGP